MEHMYLPPENPTIKSTFVVASNINEAICKQRGTLNYMRFVVDTILASL